MKQYTSKDQTIKLMELGFPFPKSIIGIRHVLELEDGKYKIDFENSYSIGELIEFLPKIIDSGFIGFFFGRMGWYIRYEDRRDMPPLTLKQWKSRELIDSLFDACVTLKEKGVI